jgi:hypothetical protein
MPIAFNGPIVESDVWPRSGAMRMVVSGMVIGARKARPLAAATTSKTRYGGPAESAMTTAAVVTIVISEARKG